MTVVGALVEARTFCSADVRAAMSRIPGLEVHGVSPDGRFIVTAEEACGSGAGACLRTVEGLAGVLSVAPVGDVSRAG